MGRATSEIPSRPFSSAVTMSEQAVHVSVEQRIIIKFLTNEGVSPTDILRRLYAQFGEKTLSRPRVFAWHKQFSGGRENVENQSHVRRPRTSVTEANIEAVRSLLEDDRRLNIGSIAATLNIGYGSAQKILREVLGFHKVSARWVPRLLSPEHKQHRLEISQRHFNRFQREGDLFLNRIVACDETWVHHYTPESKQASMEWRRSGERAPIKAKTRLSAGKIMATVFFDRQGAFHVDFLHDRRTINAQYYCDVLDAAKLSFRRKRKTQSVKNVILLHDNARPHSANITRQKVEQFGWEILEHPAYSPDLSPCDFHLFGPLKETLGGQRFDSDQAVETFVLQWLRDRPKSFYDNGIKKLPIRWEKCIARAGDYVEK